MSSSSDSVPTPSKMPLNEWLQSPVGEPYRGQKKEIQDVAYGILQELEDNRERYITEGFTFNNKPPNKRFVEAIKWISERAIPVFIDGNRFIEALNRPGFRDAVESYLTQPGTLVGTKYIALGVPSDEPNPRRFLWAENDARFLTIDFQCWPPDRTQPPNQELITDPIANNRPLVVPQEIFQVLEEEYTIATGKVVPGHILANHAYNTPLSRAKLAFANRHHSMDHPYPPILDQLFFAPKYNKRVPKGSVFDYAVGTAPISDVSLRTTAHYPQSTRASIPTDALSPLGAIFFSAYSRFAGAVDTMGTVVGRFLRSSSGSPRFDSRVTFETANFDPEHLMRRNLSRFLSSPES